MNISNPGCALYCQRQLRGIFLIRFSFLTAYGSCRLFIYFHPTRSQLCAIKAILQFNSHAVSNMAAVDGKLSHPPHPYYPPEAELIGYLENEYSVLKLLVYFAAGCVGILGSTLAIVTRIRPSMNRADQLAILWFVLCKTPRISLLYLKKKKK